VEQVVGILAVVLGGGFMALVLWRAARGDYGWRAVALEALRDVPLCVLGVALLAGWGAGVRLILLALFFIGMMVRIWLRLVVARRGSLR